MLKRGGHVIYMRHASTDHRQIDHKGDDFEDCSWQRNLSKKGRDEARAIGSGLASMDVPIGKVYSSPYCRCKDTAALAFGRYEVERELRFAIASDKEETRLLSNRLRELLLTAPAEGTNTVLVSHTANLKEAAYIWPKPEGVMVVFRQTEGGKLRYVGRITPTFWQRVSDADGQATKPL